MVSYVIFFHSLGICGNDWWSTQVLQINTVQSPVRWGFSEQFKCAVMYTGGIKHNLHLHQRITPWGAYLITCT